MSRRGNNPDGDNPDWSDNIALWLLMALASVIAAVAFSGCVRLPPIQVPVRGAASVELPELSASNDLDQLRRELAEAQALVAGKTALMAAAEWRVRRAQTEASQAVVRTTARWLTGLSILAAAGLSVAAWLVPIGRKSLFTAALACVGVCVLAQTLAATVAWLPYVGAAVLVGAGALAAFHYARLFRAGKQLGSDLHEYAKALPDEARNVLAERSVSAQEKRGLLGLVDQLLPAVTRHYREQP